MEKFVVVMGGFSGGVQYWNVYSSWNFYDCLGVFSDRHEALEFAKQKGNEK